MKLKASPKPTIRAINIALNNLVTRGVITSREAIRERGQLLRLMTRSHVKRSMWASSTTKRGI